MSNSIRVSVVIILLLIASGCGAPSKSAPEARLNAQVPTMTDDCAKLLTIHKGHVTYERKKYFEIRDRCNESLKKKATEIMRLYHAGDCNALAVRAVDLSTWRSERAFAAFMLAILGDSRGRTAFLQAFPLNDDPNGLFDPSQYTPADEGCSSGLCIDGNEPECHPWFGLDAGPGCIPTKYGDYSGCAPRYCQELPELLVQAFLEDWPGSREAVLRALAQSDGYVWGTLCHCGVLVKLTEQEWLSSAKTDLERKKVSHCFQENRNGCDGPELSCVKRVAGDASLPRCGLPSTKGNATQGFPPRSKIVR